MEHNLSQIMRKGIANRTVEANPFVSERPRNPEETDMKLTAKHLEKYRMGEIPIDGS